jgi:hypothetical protein
LRRAGAEAVEGSRADAIYIGGSGRSPMLTWGMFNLTNNKYVVTFRYEN